MKWIKGRKGLPSLFKEVEWRNADGGNIPLGKATPLEHYKKAGANIEWHEWLDESESSKDQEISSLNEILKQKMELLVKANKEIERLKGELELYEQKENDPYWYWPQCDVDECEGVSCNGGGCWKETGYWSVCSKHSQDFRDGKPQPKMKQSAIDREATRDKITGHLPSVNPNL